MLAPFSVLQGATKGSGPPVSLPDDVVFLIISKLVKRAAFFCFRPAIAAVAVSRMMLIRLFLSEMQHGASLRQSQST